MVPEPDEDIDETMRLGYNLPMGPIELGDVVGLDVRLDILEHLREELGEDYEENCERVPRWFLRP